MRTLFASTALGGASGALTLAAGTRYAQPALPQITVETTRKKPPPRPVAHRRTPTPTAVTAAPAQPTQTPAQVQETANRPVVQQTQNFDQRRDDVLLPKTGTSNYRITQQDIANLPQGISAPVKNIELQFPGVYQDSTASGDLHVRNDHA